MTDDRGLMTETVVRLRSTVVFHPLNQLLRSSLVSRHRQRRDKPWKARASEPKGSVQAPAVGVTAPGADRVGPTRYRPIARAWKGLSLRSRTRCLVQCLTLLVPYPVYNHVAAEPQPKLGISPAKTLRPQRSENNNKQFFQDHLSFPSEVGVLRALAGVKSFDREFHPMLCRTISAFI
jgi:hypothetical protein